jgi:hypothetical protein
VGLHDGVWTTCKSNPATHQPSMPPSTISSYSSKHVFTPSSSRPSSVNRSRGTEARSTTYVVGCKMKTAGHIQHTTKNMATSAHTNPQCAYLLYGWGGYVHPKGQASDGDCALLWVRMAENVNWIGTTDDLDDTWRFLSRLGFPGKMKWQNRTPKRNEVGDPTPSERLILAAKSRGDQNMYNAAKSLHKQLSAADQETSRAPEAPTPTRPIRTATLGDTLTQACFKNVSWTPHASENASYDPGAGWLGCGSDPYVPPRIHDSCHRGVCLDNQTVLRPRLCVDVRSVARRAGFLYWRQHISINVRVPGISGWRFHRGLLAILLRIRDGMQRHGGPWLRSERLPERTGDGGPCKEPRWATCVRK